MRDYQKFAMLSQLTQNDQPRASDGAALTVVIVGACTCGLIVTGGVVPAIIITGLKIVGYTLVGLGSTGVAAISAYNILKKK